MRRPPALAGARRALPAAAGLAAVAAFAPGCPTPPPVSHIEDKARLDVPIAICRKALQPTETSDGGAPHAGAYWSVVYPSFHGFGQPLRPDDFDCVGERAMTDSSFTAAALAEDDAAITTAQDGTQTVWLRAWRTPNGAAAGPLAVMRPRASELDVYAIGRYKGSKAHSRFEILELGTTRVVVAHDEACADVKVDQECDSTLSFYVVSGGQLLSGADSPAQKLRYGNVRGLGKVQYRLMTDPPAVDGMNLKVHEKLQVRDSAEQDVRRAEGDRVFVLGSDHKLVPQQDSLWSQVPKGP
jgi:hypothetical protein